MNYYPLIVYLLPIKKAFEGFRNWAGVNSTKLNPPSRACMGKHHQPVSACPESLLRVNATLNATILPIVVGETGWPGMLSDRDIV